MGTLKLKLLPNSSKEQKIHHCYLNWTTCMSGKNDHQLNVLLDNKHKPVMHKRLVENWQFSLKYLLCFKYYMYIVTFHFYLLIDVCCLGYYWESL